MLLIGEDLTWDLPLDGAESEGGFGALGRIATLNSIKNQIFMIDFILISFTIGEWLLCCWNFSGVLQE
jgi:hypothetical protein